MTRKPLYHPLKYSFYALLSEYFDNPMLEKTQNDGEYSVYVCKIHTLLLNESRYIVAITHNDHMALGTIKPLSEIKWISFQSRILESDSYFNVTRHSYQIKNDSKFHFSVQQKSSSKEQSVYMLTNNEYPLQITLLHTKGLLFEYPSTGSLISCIETYQTILTFTEDAFHLT